MTPGAWTSGARGEAAAAANVLSCQGLWDRHEATGDAEYGGLERLIRPRSVAIVGASADVSRTAGKPLPYLRKHGYTGEIMVVNPRYPSIDGVACSPSVGALPTVPDVALVLLGGEAAIGAVAELAHVGAGAAIVLAGGFAEIDVDGGLRQTRLRAAAGSMRVLGPNTIGLVNVSDRTALSASVALELDELPRGRVALVSQSGGMLGALLSRGAAHGLGFSKLVATGNEADIDVCDVMEYLLDDAETSVLALYLESVRRPDRFRRVAAAAAAAGKALVVFKVGRSEAGARLRHLAPRRTRRRRPDIRRLVPSNGRGARGSGDRADRRRVWAGDRQAAARVSGSAFSLRLAAPARLWRTRAACSIFTSRCRTMRRLPGCARRCRFHSRRRRSAIRWT